MGYPVASDDLFLLAEGEPSQGGLRGLARRSTGASCCNASLRFSSSTIRYGGVETPRTANALLAALDFRAIFEPDRNELRVRATLAPEFLPANGTPLQPLR